MKQQRNNLVNQNEWNAFSQIHSKVIELQKKNSTQKCLIIFTFQH